MYNQSNRPARTQFSHYLRTGRILPAEYFVDHKSCQSAYGEDNSLSYKSWTTRDFVEHYASGSGRTVDLAQVGLLDRFRNTRSVRNTIKEFEMRQMRIAERQANNICGRSQNSKTETTTFSDGDRTVTDVTRDAPFFSVGNSSFFRSSRCSIEVNCSRRIIRLQGTMTFEIKDWFQNPLDIGIELPKAKTYRITAKWSELMRFIFDRLGTGRWVRN